MRTPRMPHHPRSRYATLAAALPAALAAQAFALPVDTLTTVVNSTNATQTTVGFPPNETTVNVPISTYGYNPLTDEMYIVGFAPNGELRRITNVSGSQTVSRMVSQAQWLLFSRGGEPDRTGQPTVGGLLLNPKPIGASPAYSMALLVDQQTTVNNSLAVDGNTNRRNDLIQRVYSYNLQPVAPGGDARDVFTSLVTFDEAAVAAGLPTSTTNAHTVSRQFAWSTDGQSAYYIDSANATTNAFGGLWKVNVAAGTTQKIASLPGVNTEPAVIDLGGGVDQILFRGSSATNNTGGIDFVTHNGATTSPVQVFMTNTALSQFLEKPLTAAAVDSITTDTDGNVYFYEGTGRVLVRLDTAGRMSKVLQYDERDSFFTGVVGTAPNPNANMLRLQTREVTHANGFDVTQVMYVENSPLNFVAGVYAFKAGDFNRDNAVTSADLAMFAGALDLRGVTSPVDDARFDLNGNKIIDWKDVKILQQFAGFSDGDANFSGLVDYGDLNILEVNYLTAGHTWLGGDFASIDPLYATAAADVNVVNYVDLQLLAFNWDLATPTFADLDREGYTGQFRDDVIRAFNITQTAAAVPEPAGLLLTGLGALAALRRRPVR